MRIKKKRSAEQASTKVSRKRKNVQVLSQSHIL